jgi:hypothetical protein
MIFAEEIWILKDQHTQIWIDWLLKSSHHWQHHWDLMVPWMLISQNSKQTWSHIQESILCFVHMLQSFQLKKLIMNNYQLLKSQTQPLNQQIWWLNVIQDMVNIWHALCYIEVMSYQRMLMLLLQQLKQREQSNLLIGAQQDSK